MRDKLIKTVNQINFVLLTAQILTVILIWRFLPPEIPLFFSHPWGKDQLVNYSGITILPIVCLIIFFANTVVAKLAVREETLVKKTLSLASLTVTLLITISLIQIIRLVI